MEDLIDSKSAINNFYNKPNVVFIDATFRKYFSIVGTLESPFL